MRGRFLAALAVPVLALSFAPMAQAGTASPATSQSKTALQAKPDKVSPLARSISADKRVEVVKHSEWRDNGQTQTDVTVTTTVPAGETFDAQGRIVNAESGAVVPNAAARRTSSFVCTLKDPSIRGGAYTATQAVAQNIEQIGTSNDYNITPNPGRNNPFLTSTNYRVKTGVNRVTYSNEANGVNWYNGYNNLNDVNVGLSIFGPAAGGAVASYGLQITNTGALYSSNGVARWPQAHFAGLGLVQTTQLSQSPQMLWVEGWYNGTSSLQNTGNCGGALGTHLTS